LVLSFGRTSKEVTVSTEWIENTFPMDDTEASQEALERCILGDFGPESVHATLDDLVEYSQQAPVFCELMLEVCNKLLTRSWFAHDANRVHERRILIGLFLIVRRIPLRSTLHQLRHWFDRHSALLESDEVDHGLGFAALCAIYLIEGERSSQDRLWWEQYSISDVWRSKIREVERFTVRP
jgi:hypothetical protein